MHDDDRLLDSNHDIIGTVVNNKYGRCVKIAFSLQDDKHLTMRNHWGLSTTLFYSSKKKVKLRFLLKTFSDKFFFNVDICKDIPGSYS